MPEQVEAILSKLLQDKLDAQSEFIVDRIQTVISQELGFSLKRFRDHTLHANGVDPETSDDSDKPDNADNATDENQASDIAELAGALPGMPGMLSEPNDNATSPAVAGESQRLRRRSTVGAHIFSRTPPAGVTDIRHSLLHSVAELDMPQAGQPSFRQSVLEMLTAPVLNQGDSWAVENEHRTVLSQVRVSLQRKVVETTWFEGLVVFCIGLNTVMIGAASDWNLKHLHQDEPTQFQDAERLFAGIFALELFVRMFVYGPGFFWRVAPWLQGIFFLIVVSRVCENIFLSVISSIRIGNGTTSMWRL